MKGPTSDDICRDLCINSEKDAKKTVTRKAVCLRHISDTGRSRLILECPFCKSHVTAFIWSLAGCGKRCHCGALIRRGGQTHHFKKWVELNGGNND